MRCAATSYVLLVTLVALVGSACRTDNGSGDDTDGGSTVDVPDGTGCTALTPRSQDVESFVMPQGYEARMNNVIDGAQDSLDIQMYLWTSTSLADKVIAAKNRGVAVRVLMDPDHDGNSTVKSRLTAGGVTWKNAPSIYEFSHAKYLIVDKKAAVILSGNWNYDAFVSERNYGFVDRDAEDIADTQAVFDADWASANGTSTTPADLTCTRLIVSPTNSKQRLLEHINTATTKLDVEAMYVTETTIRNAIGAAKTRGAEVRVIVNEATDDSVTYFKSLGIPVKTPGGAFFLHAKLIIANDVAFVGSENYSYTSLAKNREMGGLVFEPTAIGAIKTQFETDWNAADLVP
jgi:phosphatidylserine/phosphatidylglycerophosphate/cardiolipin synthase-like enzyme